MINTKNTDSNLLEATFYENPFKFSYSSLNTLITSPQAFYNEYVLLNKTDEHKKYLLEGTLIHYLVLEHEGFDDKFIISPLNLPGENNIIIVERIFNEYYLTKNDTTLKLSDFSNQIDSILTDINLHQSVKDDTKRLAKIIEPKTELYFEFLKNKGSKTIIDASLLDLCTKRADVIKTNPNIRELLGMDLISDGINYGVYNEQPIAIETDGSHPFGLKGILDNLVVDVKKKLIRINDFKTTGKSLHQFNESVEFWNYWLQAVIQIKLVKHFLKDVIDDSWSIEFRFIVFDKYNQLYPFPISDESLKLWNDKLIIVLKQAKYHYEHRDFTLPYDFALGNVKL